MNVDMDSLHGIACMVYGQRAPWGMIQLFVLVAHGTLLDIQMCMSLFLVIFSFNLSNVLDWLR